MLLGTAALALLLSIAHPNLQGAPPRNAAGRSAAAGIDADRVTDRPLKLRPHTIAIAGTTPFALNVPEGFDISVAIGGLKRVRFMAQAPDGRWFATDMHDRTDNSKGIVYLLDGFDAERGTFARAVSYLASLRNPNSIAFHTDRAGTPWMYLALTDCLLRYRYTTGTNAPGAAPDTLARFPAYGLSYKYGGWHLTRTVVIGGDEKIYVAVGSSCNACEEKEEVRASVLQMDLDGSNQRVWARGLRNAVGVRAIDSTIVVTDMGADHLGDARPEDPMYVLEAGINYGWPSCYQYRGRIYADTLFARSPIRIDPRRVPLAYATFAAHSAPLGLEYFRSFPDPALDNYFLVALHGSSKVSLRHGYTVARVKHGTPTRDFITGFLSNGIVHGRPCDVVRAGTDAFFVTDDHAGAIYYVRRVR